MGNLQSPGYHDKITNDRWEKKYNLESLEAQQKRQEINLFRKLLSLKTHAL